MTAGPSAPLTAEETPALFAALPQQAPLLLAVSGGPDSTALMHLGARWAQHVEAPPPRVATVDHGLREASARECAAVVRDAAMLGLQGTILRCDTMSAGSGLQERARLARYRLLVAHARAIGASALVTAHTLDDQAETVLLRLCDGSGPRGLAAMRPIGETLGLPHHRPLLGVAKARLVATCEALGLAFASDPSNIDPRFARARFRDIAPLLAGEGLTPARLARLARRMAELADMVEDAARAALDEATRPASPGQAAALAFSPLAALAAPARRRALAIVIERAMAAAGSALASERPVRLERLEALESTLMAAFGTKAAARRTLSGFMLTLGADGLLTLRKESPRASATNRSQAPGIAVDSLGNGGRQD
jgi:tRNA(Ile)-lysidine synthase